MNNTCSAYDYCWFTNARVQLTRCNEDGPKTTVATDMQIKWNVMFIFGTIGKNGTASINV